MNLDLDRWREALLRFEAEMKNLKKDARKTRAPGESYDSAPRLRCKAELTRLYCLRRFAKEKLHAVGRFWRIRAGGIDLQEVTDLASQETLLRSEPGWLESFLIAPSAEATG